jgi:hypothetical protein
MKNYARYSLDATFFEVAKESYERYFELEERASSFDLKDSLELESRMYEITTRQHKHELITICFSAMCVEAFIYDYAARHTSDSYAKKYLDKLDVVAKWVVIPRLVIGKDFPRNSQAFELLKFLITTRNGLVHFKSSNVPSDQEILARALHKEEEDSSKTVKDCFGAVKMLFRELQGMDQRNEDEGWYAFPESNEWPPV